MCDYFPDDMTPEEKDAFRYGHNPVADREVWAWDQRRKLGTFPFSACDAAFAGSSRSFHFPGLLLTLLTTVFVLINAAT